MVLPTHRYLDPSLCRACFQANPLPFVGRQSLQYPNGTRQLIPSKYAYANGSVAAITADNQLPIGITWALNPLPDGKQKGSVGAVGEWEFEPPCDSVPLPGNTNQCSGEASGHLIEALCSPLTSDRQRC
eukprot:COSAG01_NODE_5779_length_4036_cov_256.771654_5_plen_129_part_00